MLDWKKPGITPGFFFCPTLGHVEVEEQAMRTRAITLSGGVALLALLLPSMSIAAVCPAPAPASVSANPLHGGPLAPVAAELADAGNPLGVPGSVLAQAFDASQSLDQVLLRIRIEACRDVAVATPAPGVLDPDNPAAYKARTEFDNTPWRFNMSQNGKNMTADEFSAWMKSRGVRVARGAAPAPIDAPAEPGSEAPADTPATDDGTVPVVPPVAPEPAPEAG